MLIDLFEKLINRLIQLKEKQTQIKKTLFESHVQPIFDDFEILHKNYLESFRSYREMIREISNYSAEVEMICDQIRTDNLFTEDKRNKIASMYTTRQLKELEPFVLSIFRYLIGAVEEYIGSEFGDDIYDRITQYYHERGELGMSQRTQYYRTSFIEDLQRLKDPSYSENERKNEAISNIDKKVKLLQEHYSYVVSDYAEIKSSLLEET